MRILAFIPARGGSKGIPKKNIALLNGIPLVHYTIKAAQASRYVSDIFLSSDDPDVIQSSEALGVKVPYRRPASLAQDDTSTIDTVLHGLDWWKNKSGYLPDALLLLQPLYTFLYFSLYIFIFFFFCVKWVLRVFKRALKGFKGLLKGL